MLPHAPQSFGFVARSAQWSTQNVGRVPCVQPHAPFTHCWPPAHARPHTPQLAALFVKLTQAPPQLAVPGAVQVDWQRAAEQTVPAAHTVPQAPQLFGLERISTQTPPQRVCPAGQVAAPSTAASTGRPVSATRSAATSGAGARSATESTETSGEASGDRRSTDASLAADASTSTSSKLRAPQPAAAKSMKARHRRQSTRTLRSIFMTRPVKEGSEPRAQDTTCAGSTSCSRSSPKWIT
jgi:hypothetical protein